MKSGYFRYPDAELLARIARDDEEAFEEIYNRYAPGMYGIAIRILRHREGAEDAVQEIFVSLWKRRAQLALRWDLGGYLAQAVRYAVLREYQQRKRDLQFQERLHQATADILSEDPVLYRDLHRTLQRMLSGLPDDQQLIFRLSRDYQLTYCEIARRLDISIKTVEKKMSQALRAIRPQMDKFLFWLGTTGLLASGLI